MINNFKQPVTQWYFSCLFSPYNIWHSGNSGWKWYSHVIFGINRDRCFVLWFFNREPCLTQI